MTPFMPTRRSADRDILWSRAFHRIGITGELTAAENGRFIAKYIRYMNIRLAHEHKRIADRIIRHLYSREKAPLNTLIISPPGVGKTTLLRDIIRLLSNGMDGYAGCNVGVVDERGEIAGAYRGSAMLDCGERTDVITEAISSREFPYWSGRLRQG